MKKLRELVQGPVTVITREVEKTIDDGKK